MEKKIRRLEIAVIALAFMFVISLCVSIYAATQITILSSKIPNYKEIKEDIKLLNDVYHVTAVKADSLHVKEKVIKGYDYTVDKAGELVEFLKEQKKNRLDK